MAVKKHTLILPAFAAIYALFILPAVSVGLDDGFRILMENRYGPAEAAKMLSMIETAAASGLPADFLVLRMREAAAKKVSASNARVMLAGRIKTLRAARSLSDQAAAAGFKIADRDSFTVRLADELDAGMSEKSFEKLLAKDYKNKTSSSLLKALYAARGAGKRPPALWKTEAESEIADDKKLK